LAGGAVGVSSWRGEHLIIQGDDIMDARRTALFSLGGAIAGAVALAASMTPAPAQAADGVKCYGISMAGQNDCANTAGNHSCAGLSKDTYSGQDWKAVKDQAACTAEKGKLEPFDGVNPAKKA
jgi:uncharacterized membrane protein